MNKVFTTLLIGAALASEKADAQFAGIRADREWKQTGTNGVAHHYALQNLPNGQKVNMTDSAGHKTLYIENWGTMDIIGEKIAISTTPDDKVLFQFTSIDINGVTDDQRKTARAGTFKSDEFVAATISGLQSGALDPQFVIANTRQQMGLSK